MIKFDIIAKMNDGSKKAIRWSGSPEETFLNGEFDPFLAMGVFQADVYPDGAPDVAHVLDASQVLPNGMPIQQ